MPPTNIMTYVTKIAFCITLVFTYPLQLSPANNVIESYLTKGMEKSKKRQWIKNASRITIICFTLALSLTVWLQISQFLEVTGALTCAPLAFTMPAMYHYKIAKTQKQKCIDMTIVVVSLTLAVFCIYTAITEWIKSV